MGADIQVRHAMQAASLRTLSRKGHNFNDF